MNTSGHLPPGALAPAAHPQVSGKAPPLASALSSEVTSSEKSSLSIPQKCPCLIPVFNFPDRADHFLIPSTSILLSVSVQENVSSVGTAPLQGRLTTASAKPKQCSETICTVGHTCKDGEMNLYTTYSITYGLFNDK